MHNSINSWNVELPSSRTAFNGNKNGAIIGVQIVILTEMDRNVKGEAKNILTVGNSPAPLRFYGIQMQINPKAA